nr:lamin tail domain-containing protein [Halomarina salina]
MRPGSTKRNAVVGLLYLCLVPLVILGLPVILAGVVWRDYRGWGTRLARLPGIAPGGGAKAGVVAGLYGLGLLVVLSALGGTSSDPQPESGPSAPTDTSTAAATTSAAVSTDVPATSTPERRTESRQTQTDSVPDPSRETSVVPTASTTAAPESPAPVATADQTPDRTDVVPTQTPSSTPALPTETPAPGELVVVRVHADAQGGDERDVLNDEYIVFENSGGRPLDIGGWLVEDEKNHRYYVPDGVTLQPGQSITLHTGRGSDSSADLYWNADAPVWNNDGDTVFVRDSSGTLVIRHEYS